MPESGKFKKQLTLIDLTFIGLGAIFWFRLVICSQPCFRHCRPGGDYFLAGRRICRAAAGHRLLRTGRGVAARRWRGALPGVLARPPAGLLDGFHHRDCLLQPGGDRSGGIPPVRGGLVSRVDQGGLWRPHDHWLDRAIRPAVPVLSPQLPQRQDLRQGQQPGQCDQVHRSAAGHRRAVQLFQTCELPGSGLCALWPLGHRDGGFCGRHHLCLSGAHAHHLGGQRGEEPSTHHSDCTDSVRAALDRHLCAAATGLPRQCAHRNAGQRLGQCVQRTGPALPRYRPDPGRGLAGLSGGCGRGHLPQRLRQYLYERHTTGDLWLGADRYFLQGVHPGR